MNLLFRILLAVYAFFLTILSSIAIAIAVKPQIFERMSDYLLGDFSTNNSARLIMGLIASIVFILSLMFLFSGVRSDRDRKSVTKFTNIGEIKISLNSVESIALAASRKLNGVRETKAYVSKLDDSVTITIKAIILSDINIPNISEDIQVRVKTSVEETTGIKVNDVRVLVDNIYNGYKSRVE